MQITVFGASGNVGQLVVAEVLSRGHTVSAFVHSHNPFNAAEDLDITTGDIGDKQAVRSALKGSDGVVCALGSWGTPTKDILTRGMRSIIPVMEELSIQRIVTVTGSGALWSQDTPNIIRRAEHAVMGLTASRVLSDSEAHIRLLESSQLAWTSVRSPIMTNGSNTAYRLDTKLPSALVTIPRKAVANCLVDMIEGDGFSRQAPVIHRL